MTHYLWRKLGLCIMQVSFHVHLFSRRFFVDVFNVVYGLNIPERMTVLRVPERGVLLLGAVATLSALILGILIGVFGVASPQGPPARDRWAVGWGRWMEILLLHCCLSCTTSHSIAVIADTFSGSA